MKDNYDEAFRLHSICTKNMHITNDPWFQAIKWMLDQGYKKSNVQECDGEEVVLLSKATYNKLKENQNQILKKIYNTLFFEMLKGNLTVDTRWLRDAICEEWDIDKEIMLEGSITTTANFGNFEGKK